MSSTTFRNGFQYISLATGDDVRRQPGITIHDVLRSAPNTAELRIDGKGRLPLSGEMMEIKDAQDADRLLFRGTVQSVEKHYEGETSSLGFNIGLTDFTWLFNRRRPVGTYVRVSASDVVIDLITRFAPNFTTNFVQTNLAKVTVTLDGSKSLFTVLGELASAIGGGQWYVDYDQAVHFFHVVPPGLQLPFIEFEDLGVHITLAEGGLIPSTFSFERGFYFVRHAFVYDDDSVSKFGAISNVIELSGHNEVVLSGIPTGSAIGALTCVARRIYINRFLGNDIGHPIETIEKYAQVDDNVTVGFTSWFGPLNASVADVIEISNTAPLPQRHTRGHLIGPTTSTHAEAHLNYQEEEPMPWFTLWMQFKVAYLYRNGTVSFPGPASNSVGLKNAWRGFGVIGFDLIGIPLGPTINNNDVVARFVYGCIGRSSDPNFSLESTTLPPFGFAWPIPMLDPTWEESDVGPGLFALVPDNTTVTLNNTANAKLGVTLAPFYEDQIPRRVGRGNKPYNNGLILSVDPVPIWPNPDGPSLEDVDPPGDLNSSNVDLLRSISGEPIRVITDTSQIRNRVIVVGAGSVVLATYDIGDTDLLVNEIANFSPNGGAVRIEDAATGQFQTVPYDGVKGVPGETFVVLSLPLSESISQGSIINNYFEANDFESQDALSRSEQDKDGNFTDGVHEYVIIEPTYKALFQLYMRAFAELELWSKPIRTLFYSTRDPKSKSGQTITVDLTNPPVIGDFLIQEVTIDQIHDESDQLLPRYSVIASSMRFELNDLLLQIIQNTSGDKSSVSAAGLLTSANRNIASALGSITPPKLLWQELILTDSQLKTGGTFELLPAVADNLYMVVSYYGWMEITTGGGSNVTVSSIRYGVDNTDIIAAFSLLVGAAGGNRFSQQIMKSIDIQSAAQLIGRSVEIVLAGTAGGTFVSQSGYHILLQYLEVDA